MTRSEAIIHLGGDEGHIDEFVTQEVFDLKTKLLKGALVPQVMTKKAEKLHTMADALIVFGYEEEAAPDFDLVLPDTLTLVEDLIGFYRVYEQKLSALKLQLMQAFHPRIIASTLSLMASLEGKKYQILANRFEQEDLDVKLSEHVDSGVILSELKSAASGDNLSGSLSQFPTLKKEISKSFKYCKFVEAKKSR
jgi:hypothetical protein